MKILFIIYLPLLLTFSCTFIRKDDSIDLGDKFRYIQDYPQTIVYHEAEKYSGTGVNVIDPIVVAYRFNDEYIIAKSRKEEIIKKYDSLDEPIQYWIINKKVKPDSLYSMDSSTFYRRLKELNINLKFKEK